MELFNEVPGITNDILSAGKSCSKMNETEPRHNESLYNEIPIVTNTFSQSLGTSLHRGSTVSLVITGDSYDSHCLVKKLSFKLRICCLNVWMEVSFLDLSGNTFHIFSHKYLTECFP